MHLPNCPRCHVQPDGPPGPRRLGRPTSICPTCGLPAAAPARSPLSVLVVWFHNRSIRTKQMLVLITSEFLSVVVLAIIGGCLIVEVGRAQLLQQAQSELAVTYLSYNAKVEQMALGFRGQAENTAIRAIAQAYVEGETIPPALVSQVKQILRHEIQARHIEYATLVGPDRQIIVSANADRQGEWFDPAGLVTQVLETRTLASSNEIVPWSDIHREHPPLPQFLLKGQGLLIRYVVTPVIDQQGQPLGALVAGNTVNGKHDITTETVMAFGGGYSAIFQVHPDHSVSLCTLYASQPGVAATIGRQPAPIAAAPQDTDRSLWPTASLFNRAIAAPGKLVTERQRLGDRPYTLAASTLTNHQGQPVAIIVRGTSETALNALIGEHLAVQLLWVVLVFGVNFWVARFLGTSLVHPIQQLQLAADKFSLGDRAARAQVCSRDEVGKLATTFNAMAAAISHQEEELETFNADLAEMVQAQTAELTAMIYQDDLTGLPSRALLLQTLKDILHTGKVSFALVILDCDKFKVVTSSLGHLVSNGLLIAIANRLVQHLHPGDMLARTSEDEFCFLLHQIPDNDHLLPRLQAIQASFEHPFAAGGCEIFMTACLGVALGYESVHQAEELLQDASTALYQAKLQGRGSYQIFDRSMRLVLLSRLTLESELQQALERKEFILHYQPIADLHTQRLAGFEALIRWQHPEKGPIAPDVFIPCMETTGLIVPVGILVLQQACQQLQQWQSRGWTELTMSVNLSVRQFSSPTLLADVDHVLAETAVNPACLKLEITESAIMENAEMAIHLTRELRSRQIQISIDDFGTGYSSLGYLHRFPLDILKIDRSFVSRLQFESRNYQVVETIVALSQQLGLSVIAEGIETAQQVEWLKHLGCEFGQGYFFAQPLPVGEIERRFFQPPSISWPV